MIFFTADLHLGQEKFLDFTKRPFDDVHQMSDYIIDSINLTIKEEDTLYILGDFCGRTVDPEPYIKRINCNNINLIYGNHDLDNRTLCEKHSNIFQEVSIYKEIMYDNNKVVLFHYPLRRWNKDWGGSWMLYGHAHNNLSEYDNRKLTLDVGVDNTISDKRFGTPRSIIEIKKLFNLRKEKISSFPIDNADKILYDRRNKTR
tara:strand:+ start:126 stop:731 length:606 start_codon:yes stop_codon:yes gene_type:complete